MRFLNVVAATALLLTTPALGQNIKLKLSRDAAHRYAPIAQRAVSLLTKLWPKKLVYASATSSGKVDTFKGGHKAPTGPIYSFQLNPGVANSLQVDRKGNLYLADSYSTWVYEYAPGTNTPLKSFPTSQTPDSIAVRGNTLYVFQSQEGGSSNSIEIYEHGSTTPTRSLSDGAIEFPTSIAVDGQGNVFVGYQGQNFTSGVGEFVKGQMPMVVLPLEGMSLPLAIAVDVAGDLVVDNADTIDTSDLLIYPPGQTTPSKTILGLRWLYQFSFTADGKAFYAGPAGQDEQDQSYYLYHYPSGKLIYNYRMPNAYVGVSGIAPAPAAEPGVWGKLDR